MHGTYDNGDVSLSGEYFGGHANDSVYVYLRGREMTQCSVRARVARGTHALHGGRDGRHEQPPQLGVPSDQPAHLRSTGSAQIMQVA